MNVTDPFELPEIRVKTAAPETSNCPPRSETKNERLARLWIEAWQARRQAEEAMARLRKEIEPILDSGGLVGGALGTVAWSESMTLKADPLALAQDVGLRVYAKVSTVSATKLRELIQGGLVATDAPYLSCESVRRLVTTLR